MQYRLAQTHHADVVAVQQDLGKLRLGTSIVTNVTLASYAMHLCTVRDCSVLFSDVLEHHVCMHVSGVLSSVEGRELTH